MAVDALARVKLPIGGLLARLPWSRAARRRGRSVCEREREGGAWGLRGERIILGSTQDPGSLGMGWMGKECNSDDAARGLRRAIRRA